MPAISRKTRGGISADVKLRPSGFGVEPGQHRPHRLQRAAERMQHQAEDFQRDRGADRLDRVGAVRPGARARLVRRQRRSTRGPAARLGFVDLRRPGSTSRAASLRAETCTHGAFRDGALKGLQRERRRAFWCDGAADQRPRPSEPRRPSPNPSSPSSATAAGRHMAPRCLDHWLRSRIRRASGATTPVASVPASERRECDSQEDFTTRRESPACSGMGPDAQRVRTGSLAGSGLDDTFGSGTRSRRRHRTTEHGERDGGLSYDAASVQRRVSAGESVSRTAFWLQPTGRPTIRFPGGGPPEVRESSGCRSNDHALSRAGIAQFWDLCRRGSG